MSPSRSAAEGAAVALAVVAALQLPAIFLSVEAPASPSAVRPLFFWNCVSAACVYASKTPSATPVR